MSDNPAAFALLVHLVGVVLWTGPAIGGGVIWIFAWWARQRRPRDEQALELERWVREKFLWTVALEHVGFLILIAGGLMRLHAMGLLEWRFLTGGAMPAWLRYKLGLVAFVLVPMEILDIWLSHWLVPRRGRRAKEDPAAWARAERAHDRMLLYGGVVALASIAWILYLVSYRPL